MKYTKGAALLLLILFMSTMAYSQGDEKLHRIDSLYDECLSGLKGSFGKIDCASKAEEEWDKELNKYYRLLMHVLEADAQNELRLAQRQWIKYRDAEIEFAASLYDMDGTMYPRLGAARVMRIVRMRALELKRYYWIRTEEE